MSVTGSTGPVKSVSTDAAGTPYTPSAVDGSDRALVVGPGTAGSPTGGLLTVQGVASMTPLLATSTDAGVGGTTDAAATVGSTGSLNAKQRLMTSQLDLMATLLTVISGELSAGASVHYRTSTGTSEDEHEIKATSGRLLSITVTNTNAAARYLRLYNLAASNVTPGTSTVFLCLAIPGSTSGAGFTVSFAPMGLAFTVALTGTLTTGAADTDVAEVAANEIKVVYTYR